MNDAEDKLLEDAFATPKGKALLTKFHEMQAAVARTRSNAETQPYAPLQPHRPDVHVRARLVVVAGNASQAEQYIRHVGINPFDVTIAENVDRLRGLDRFDVLFTGTWYRRDDIEEVFGVMTATIVARKLRGDDEIEITGVDMQNSAGASSLLGTQQSVPAPTFAKSFRP